MKSSAQLEQEAEQARSGVIRTLDELRARTTPGQMVDELIDYARATNGGMFLRNLRQQIVDNPLPLTLLAAGIAWLAFQNARPALRGYATTAEELEAEARAAEARSRVRDIAQRASAAGRRMAGATDSAVEDVKERTSETAALLAGSARDAGARARAAVNDATESATSAVEQLRARTSSAYDAAASAAASVKESAATAAETVKESSAALARNVRDAAVTVKESSTAAARTAYARGQDAFEFAREQPLVLGGLGFALGAALGAALPPSEIEDELIGPTSDEAKDATRRLAGKAMEQGRGVYEEVKSSLATATGEAISSSPPTSDYREAAAATRTEGELEYADSATAGNEVGLNAPMEQSGELPEVAKRDGDAPSTRAPQAQPGDWREGATGGAGATYADATRRHP